MSGGGRSRRFDRSLLRLGALALLVTLLQSGVRLRAAQADPGGDTPDRAALLAEREKLLAENAALSARLTLGKDPDAYLVADLPEGRLLLELQGVTLTSIPIEEVRLNPHARRLLVSDDRFKILETPFLLGDDRWFDSARTLAVKDSAAVRSKPDTTGTLMELIRTTPVTALLTYDRRLTVVLDGVPPRGFWGRLRDKVSGWLQSWSSGTLQGTLRRQSGDEIMITLRMSPPDVRSLAPTLTEGTKLILVL